MSVKPRFTLMHAIAALLAWLRPFNANGAAIPQSRGKATAQRSFFISKKQNGARHFRHASGCGPRECARRVRQTGRNTQRHWDCVGHTY